MIRRSFAALPIAAVACSLAAPAPALAQDAGDADAASGEDVVVSAARTALPPSALPLTIDIIDRAALDRQVAIAGSVEYSVAKTGVWMLTKGFAVEVGRHGIRVNAVGPGVIETPMTAELRRSGRFVEKIERATPLRRLGRPEDIAAACAFLCSDDASFVTGEIIYPDGGYLAPQRL